MAKETMRNEILQGDVIQKLAEIPDNHVHCCVTSPPYWGLRSYGTNPQIWADGKQLCDVHEWDVTKPRRNRSAGDVVNMESKQATSVGTLHDLLPTNTCRVCNAWRGELGAEPTPELYVAHMVRVFREVKRVLRDDGTLWLNIGDSYCGSMSGGLEDNKAAGRGTRATVVEGSRPNAKIAGIKPKDLVGIPWMLAFALRADGWWLRSDIIWDKPNPMPESVTDRPTKAHEYIFLLAKSQTYFYDAEAIKEAATGYDGRKDTIMKGSEKYQDGADLQNGNANSLSVKGRERWKYKNLQEDGQRPHTMHEKRLVGDDVLTPIRNKRSVWKISTKPYAGAHFATFPEQLPKLCILAGTSAKGVCDRCGAPQVRMVERKAMEFNRSDRDSRMGITDPHKRHTSGTMTSPPESKTVGWEASCECNAGTQPAIVLDPFFGSGTTGKVAVDNGRDWLGIELNPKYVTLAKKRISSAKPQLIFQ